LVSAADREVRFSLADENNLNSKEELFFDFGNINNAGAIGLVLSFRQTLMTTYLFYSALGYMGDKIGKYFASMETNEEKRKNFDATSRILGGIAVFLWNEVNQTWDYQSKVTETGPIAFNHQILPLGSVEKDQGVKLKLIMNKGLWQLDCLSVTNIREKVVPVEIKPAEILNKGKIDPAALAQIDAEDQYLISMPGSEYKFNFDLPDENQDYELFLYAKGYYLEWMREHWLKDKNVLKMNQLVNNPGQFLRAEAKNYKRYETEMAPIFWDSKINVKTFSYHEN
jgi:hypothetical protein